MKKYDFELTLLLWKNTNPTFVKGSTITPRKQVEEASFWTALHIYGIAMEIDSYLDTTFTNYETFDHCHQLSRFLISSLRYPSMLNFPPTKLQMLFIIIFFCQHIYIYIFKKNKNKGKMVILKHRSMNSDKYWWPARQPRRQKRRSILIFLIL